MIQPTTLSPIAPELRLPKQVNAEGATIEAFGQVYAANNKQFATRETADALAGFLGGKVSDLSEQWGLGRISPLYQIEFGNGKSLNAGLLADRFIRYGDAAALSMTEAELGMPVRASAAPVQTVPAATVPAVSVQVQVATAPAQSPASPALAAPQSIIFGQTAPGETPAPSDAEQKKLLEAARQFESLLMAQILKSAIPEDDGSQLMGASDGPSQGLYQLALENFAGILGQHGGLGLANSVSDHYNRSSPKTSILG